MLRENGQRRSPPQAKSGDVKPHLLGWVRRGWTVHFTLLAPRAPASQSPVFLRGPRRLPTALAVRLLVVGF